MFINDITFYLSSNTKETSEIISNLIFNRKPQRNFADLKKFILSESHSLFFRLFIAIPYWNLLNLSALYEIMRNNGQNITEIGSLPIEHLFEIFTKILEGNHEDFTLRSLNCILKLVTILKKHKFL